MIKHIVMWKIKENNIQKVQEKFESMMNEIPQIMKIETGKNINSKYTNRNFVLVTYHNSVEDLYNYQTHPYHVEVSKFVSKYVSDRTCVDFELQSL